MTLAVGCAEPAPAPAPERPPASAASAPAPPAREPPRAAPPARDPTRPADPERVAELERRLRAEAGRPAPDAPPTRPAPADEPEQPDQPRLDRLDLDGLVAALGEAIGETEATAPPPPGAGRAALRAHDQELSRLERRLRGVAYQLQLRLDERVRAWEREHAQEDAPLASEEQRLLARSAAIVIGPDRAYVDSPDQELEQVRTERAALRAAQQERVAALKEAYRPLLERAAAARADVGTARRAVQRRLAGQD